ncbi:MAG: hypothetical protein V7L22_03655 [Nostoc sp.]
MRINVSTLFRVITLIAQDVVAFEAQQASDNKVSTLPSETPATNSQTPAQ